MACLLYLKKSIKPSNILLFLSENIDDYISSDEDMVTESDSEDEKIEELAQIDYQNESEVQELFDIETCDEHEYESSSTEDDEFETSFRQEIKL